MDIFSVLLLLGVLLIVVLFITQPFKKQWQVHAEAGQEQSSLLAERDRILTEIQELDFDHTLGKISPEDYPIQRNLLVHKGTEVLRQLDNFVPARHVKGSKTKAEAAVPTTEQLAQAISDEDLEIMIAKRRTAHASKTAGFCPRCGKPLLQSDRFCGCCGEPVRQPVKRST